MGGKLSQIIKSSTIDLILSRISIDENNCWNWLGVKTPKGYGHITVNQVSFYTHRLVFEFFNGELDKKLQIDHLCRNHSCINPRHLEAVTQKENILRGVGITAKYARRTHCNKGHPFSGDNLTFSNNVRRCRKCHNDAERLRQSKLRLKENTQ